MTRQMAEIMEENGAGASLVGFVAVGIVRDAVSLVPWSRGSHGFSGRRD